MIKRAWPTIALFLGMALSFAVSCQTPGPPPIQTPLPTESSLGSPTPPQPSAPAPTPLTLQTPLTPPTQRTLQTQATLLVEVVARNLEVPWSMAFAPDGRLFFTERPGRLQAMEPGKPPQLLATLGVAHQVEAGLLGLALSPRFADDHQLYVYYTYSEGGALKNRVVRLTLQGGKAVNPMVLLENIPGAGIHDGGRLRFGPDGKLYIATGDAAQSELAQDIRSLAGKILRLNPDGSIPPDNPFPASPVYSLGHRNPQGLDWHPVTGRLYAVEHGPSGHDELNLILPGGNFGWPRVTGRADASAQFLNPLLESGSGTWAPSGASFYRGSRLAGWQGSLFFAALRGQALHRVVFRGPDFTEIEVHRVVGSNTWGRLRDVVAGPDGFLYIATSNRDGRGQPSAEDDRILRIVASGG